MGLFSRFSKNKSILNMLWLSGDSIIRMGLGFLVSVWLARYMGPDQFGIFNYGLAMIAIYTAVASLGMNGVVVRELVRAPDQASVIMGSSFVLQIVGSILASLLVIASTMILRPNEWSVLLIVLVMVPSVLLRSTDIIKYWFESVISAKYTVIAQNIAFVTSSALKIGTILLGGSYVIIAVTVTVEALIVALLLIYLYRRKKINIVWQFDFSTAKKLLSQSWPLILSGLALMLYMRVDQIMIGNMVDNAAVGIYSVAVKMVEVWYFFPVAIVSSLFPKIIKEKEVSEDRYNERMQFLYDIMVVVGVSLAIVVTILSDYIISLFYGYQYAEASRLIKIYAWVSIFYFLSSASGRWYINEGLQVYALTRNIMGLAIAISLNFILIPKFGSEGAAFATLVAYFFASYLFDFFNQKTRISFLQKSKSLWVFGAILRIRKAIKG
ncbi:MULTISPECIES: flippase [Serratia]|uniref:flippase n=1 Tax=Serratia TaxID=613 RepID=UPI000DF9F81B|nr:MULTISPECIES: flippase [Serratia]MBV6690982.1 flippase [Serratia quinivorans]RYM87464.1 flippase [Serratia liquefaciens]CAI1727457.1 Polysaccharide biosynthesis protein [Serratia liquefaciens]CAI1748177.1 Polysaccharide biosynthesis protein [Serratia liquefaciens]CAI2456091.1 Polysaccharide biosynthesis protein [Serratia liquefaciens]